MPKILNAEVAKTLAYKVLAGLRSEHPEFNDAQIRAVLNTAASLTTPFVKKVTTPVAEPVQEQVQEPVAEAVAEPVSEFTTE